jgi:hypothetical protein
MQIPWKGKNPLCQAIINSFHAAASLEKNSGLHKSATDYTIHVDQKPGLHEAVPSSLNKIVERSFSLMEKYLATAMPE